MFRGWACEIVLRGCGGIIASVKVLLPVIFASLSGACLFAQEALEPLRISIDPAMKVASIPEDFLGFGYETSALAREGFFHPDNKHMVQLYRNLTPHGLARIGGIIGDLTRYEPEGTLVAETQKGTTVINRKVLEDFGAFLRVTGWKAMWTLNLGTGTKEDAAQQAQAVQKALGDRLHSFEIGNEVDLLKRFNGYDAYHAAYLEYKAAVRAVLPDAVFSGPDSANNVDWTVWFAKTEAKDMGLLIHHYYRGGAKTPQATIETMLGPHPEWDGKLARMRQACAANGVAFRINEVNSFYGGGKADVSDTFASALWCLDYMFRVAEYGGAGVNMQTDVNQLGFISHYSPIHREPDGKLTARPEYYGMLAFSVAGKGDLLKPAITPLGLNLTAYATKAADGSMWVSVLNKDLAKAAKVGVLLPAGYRKAEAMRLTAPSAQSKTSVRLAGAEVAEDGTWAPKDVEKLDVVNGGITLTMPATTAALVHLQP